MCREELPPGPEKLFEEGAMLFVPIKQRNHKGDKSFRALVGKDRKQMEIVVEKWTLAARQGHAEAQYNLGAIHQHG